MTEISRRSTPASPFPLDLRDLFDPISMLLAWGASPQVQSIRVEAHFEQDEFVVLAELPGIDPQHDVEVTVTGDVLTLRAERSEEKKEKHHSEFHYGSFSRSLRLPGDARTEEVTATYDAGILTVHVPLSKPAKASARAIEVKMAKTGAHKAEKEK